MRKISRAQAISAGLSRYFTGKPCQSGHIDERYTANGTCAECIRIRSRQANAEIRQSLREAKAARSQGV